MASVAKVTPNFALNRRQDTRPEPQVHGTLLRPGPGVLPVSHG